MANDGTHWHYLKDKFKQELKLESIPHKLSLVDLAGTSPIDVSMIPFSIRNFLILERSNGTFITEPSNRNFPRRTIYE